MPFACCVSWFGSAILDVIAAAPRHSLSCEEREGAAEAGLNRVGNEIVAARIGQSIVSICGITDAGSAETVALNCASDTARGAASSPASAATTLRTASADSDSVTSYLDVGVVVAVETFFRTAFRGISQHGSTSDLDGPALSVITVNCVISKAIADDYAAFEANRSWRIDAVIIALEVVFASVEDNRSVRLQLTLQAFSSSLTGRNNRFATIYRDGTCCFDGFGRRCAEIFGTSRADS